MNLPVKKYQSPLMDPAAFDQMQRVGKVLAASPLFPEHLRKGSKESAMANGILVLNMAERLNEEPLTVAQNIYFVGGKPSWSSTYMISKANQRGIFENPIDWEVNGSGDGLSVTAFGILKATKKRAEATCSMEMARAENWVKNPKYKSMPEQMLRYRSATFLIRLYCPEVMVGMPAQVEVELGMKDVTPDDAAHMTQMMQETVKAKDVEDAEIVETSEEVDDVVEEGEDTSEPASENEQTETGEDKSEEILAKHKQLSETILNDLTDAGPDAVSQFYSEQIAQMEIEAPEIHADLMRAFEDFGKAA